MIERMVLASSNKGDIVLDACAAPGGKGLHLLNKEKSINLTVLEISKQRFKLLEENFSRAQLKPTLICNDLLTPHQALYHLLQKPRLRLDRHNVKDVRHYLS